MTKTEWRNPKTLRDLRGHSVYKGARGIVTLIILSIGFILAVRLLGDMKAASQLPEGGRRARIMFADALGLVALLPVHWLLWFLLQLLIDIADNLVRLNQRLSSFETHE